LWLGDVELMLQSFMIVKPGCRSFFCRYLVIIYIFNFMFQLCCFVYVNCTFYVIPSKMGATSGAGTAYPSGEHDSPPGFSMVRVTRSLVLCVMYRRSLFVPLPFLFWPLCCLFFFVYGFWLPLCYLQTLLNFSLIMF